MSNIIETAVSALAEKLGGETLDGSVKFVLGDDGAVRIDENGASADDSDADCTMTADTETFQAIMDGDINPTSAFMTGKLKIDGDMGMAMKLGALLS